MTSENERHDRVDHSENVDMARDLAPDAADGGIAMDLFWARLDPLDA